MKINKRQIVNAIVLILVSIFSITIGATAATTITASQVIYNGTTVQEKIDELVTKVQSSDNSITCTPGHYCTTSTSCPSGALCSKVKIDQL